MNDSAYLSNMQDIGEFEDQGSLKKFLALQLLNGRLALVLGAGVSMGFGLPDWDGLTNRLYLMNKLTRPAEMSNEIASQNLLMKQYENNRMRFAEAVRSALYEGFDVTASVLLKNELLIAITSLVMSSARGSVKKIISFNYDDLIEQNLGVHGFTFRSISILPAWNGIEDVFVYHPHGFLPSNKQQAVPRPIVYTLDDYDDIVGQSAEGWRSAMLEILQSNTCIFIGLSGDDKNLTSLLNEVKKHHISKSEQHACWGVRFTDNVNDPNQIVWESKNIYQETLISYNDLPNWLLEICQIAAQMRSSQHRGY